MIVKLHRDKLGFLYEEFVDQQEQICRIHESRLNKHNEKYIWLGVEGCEMHLNQEQVAALIPLLQTFVRTGYLQNEAPREIV